MRQVIHDEKTYALVLSMDDFEPGAKFLSEPEWPLQVGLLSLPTGHAIAPHTHLSQNRCTMHAVQEFLLVVSGKMEADFFDETGCRFHSETMKPGDALLYIRGGHAFRFLEPTHLLEVKSGPYLGREKDKVFFCSSSASPS